MSVMISNDKKDLVVNCKCGCENTIHIRLDDTDKDSDYYVFAILESDKKNTPKYEQYARSLNKVYYIDMTNSFNKSHIGEETKVEENIKDIVISDTALFHVKGGKIEGHYIGYDEITKYLISLAKK